MISIEFLIDIKGIKAMQQFSNRHEISVPNSESVPNSDVSF